jgi:hypothetical protein
MVRQLDQNQLSKHHLEFKAELKICHCCLINLPDDNSIPSLSMQCSFQIDGSQSISYLSAYLNLNRIAVDKNTESGGDLNICRECTIQLENAYMFQELCRQTIEWRIATIPIKKEKRKVGRPKTSLKLPQEALVKATGHKLLDKSIKSRPRFSCHVCPKVYMQSKRFRQHLLNCHQEKSNTEDRFNCDQCSKNFANESGRREHIRVIHQKQFISCDLCHKTFKYKSGLSNHKWFCPVMKTLFYDKNF